MPRLDRIEKLPLAVRKNVRDGFESKKQTLEKQLSDLLGEAWTITVDPNAIYPYAEEDSYGHNSLGDCLHQYFDSAIYNIKYLIEKDSEAAKTALNTIVHAHVLTMDLDEDKTETYCGCKVTEAGALAIVFAEDKLATNIDGALEKSKLTKALDDAPQRGLPMNFSARVGIQNEYEPQVAAVQTKLNALAGTEALRLVPNFEDNFARLQAGGGDVRDDYPTNLGDFTRRYFEALNWYLDYQKFGSDDMLQEGLQEVLEGNEVHFRIVDKLGRSYNEPVFEGGRLYLQTDPKNYGTNVDNVADKLIDLL